MPWTPDLADTWAQAYGLVAKVMVAAAEEREDIAPAYWEALVSVSLVCGNPAGIAADPGRAPAG